MTLPEEVRSALNVNPQDKIVFRISDDTIEIVGKLPSLTEMAGSITPLQPTLSIAETIHLVREEQSNKQFTRNPQP